MNPLLARLMRNKPGHKLTDRQAMNAGIGRSAMLDN
jgi:hypothetical protein